MSGEGQSEAEPANPAEPEVLDEKEQLLQDLLGMEGEELQQV